MMHSAFRILNQNSHNGKQKKMIFETMKIKQSDSISISVWTAMKEKLIQKKLSYLDLCFRFASEF